MRRWNGWGDESQHKDLPPAAKAVLENLVGRGAKPRDVTLADVTKRVPASRLTEHPLITTDAEQRVRHARGQSFPDLIATRSGAIEAFPDGVAFPQTHDDVQTLLDFARQHGVKLIPYGGGTSVVGHVNASTSDQPILTVSMSRLQRLLDLNPTERLATFGAGVLGPDLEAKLQANGFTLGHFPQSFELSSLGGWIATRSSGQQSLGFGRIEQLFAGGKVATPQGTLDLAPFPASAAGPDVRDMILGSEGRMGIITEATVRIRPIPERDDVYAIFFPNWEQAHTAARKIVQIGVPLSMMRLSTPTETMTNLALAGHERVIKLLERGLAWRDIGDQKCMLLLGVMGSKAQTKLSLSVALEIAREHDGVSLGKPLGKQWQKGRFRAPYMRNSAWEQGYAIDTLETATTWDTMPRLLNGIEDRLRGALLNDGERVHVFTHLSHFYSSGSSIYTTYVFRLGETSAQTLERWQRLKSAASSAIVEHGGTISHQHGVGVDHRPYLPAEKGELGMNAIKSLINTFDPDGVMHGENLVQVNGKQ